VRGIFITSTNASTLAPVPAIEETVLPEVDAGLGQLMAEHLGIAAPAPPCRSEFPAAEAEMDPALTIVEIRAKIP
jgi:hypothetical protein